MCPAEMNAVEIDSLTYTYPGAPQPTLNNISLQIEQGDFLAVVGNNGCGKSTLCKVLNGLIPHFITGDFHGEVRVEGLNTLDSDVGALAQKVGYVYQDFENQIVRPTVLDDASYSCLNYAFSDYLERGRRALRQCGLEGREEEYVWQLSGGQMRRASLAIGVALEPSILLLDEPTANLDIATRREIMAVLEDMKDIIQTAVIATHDMQLVCQWAERIIVLCGGQVVADGSRDEIFSRPDLVHRVGIRPPEIFSMARELDPRALCYTVDDFTHCFLEA